MDDRRAHKKLVHDVHRDFHRVGTMEEINVDRLAILLWQEEAYSARGTRNYSRLVLRSARHDTA